MKSGLFAFALGSLALAAPSAQEHDHQINPQINQLLAATAKLAKN